MHLDRLIPDAEVFILFSSTGGFLAQAGQANYAAANAGLDALARDRRARGRHALSIAWGVWADTGLVRDDTGARNVEELGRQGIQAFSADQGVALFAWLLRRDEPMITVLPATWSVFRRARAGRTLPLFRHQLEGIADSDGREPSNALAARVRGATSPLERRQLIDGAVRDAAARVLRLPATRLDARRPLGSVGLDSLMALELRNRLEALFERSLPATLLWNYPTLEALSMYLADSLAPVVAPAATVSTATESIAGLSFALGDVAQMSDDDAAQALRATRQRSRPRG
jgi:myxalamid-type polyketide synthase MxaE and MxaD